MQRVIVNLAISPNDYQQYYSGRVRQVVTHDSNGRRIRFPANILQHVVGHDGIYGHFAIEFDDDGRFQRIVRL